MSGPFVWNVDGGRVEEASVGHLVIVCSGCGERLVARLAVTASSAVSGDASSNEIRRRISLGVAAGKRRSAEEGRQPNASRPAYGYNIVRKIDVMQGLFPLSQVGRYKVDEEEARCVRFIFDEYLQCGSFTEIARTLTSQKVPPPLGEGGWSRSVVSRILRREAYIGKATYGKHAVVAHDSSPESHVDTTDGRVLVPIECPAIVSEEVFYAVQACMANRGSKLPAVGGHRRVAVLQGMVRCGDCGGAMRSGTYARSKNRRGGAYYACTRCAPTWNANSPRPRWSTYPASVVHEAVRERLVAVLPSEDGSLVTEFLFTPAWNVPMQVRTRLLQRSNLSVWIFNEPLRIEASFVDESDDPRAAPGLIRALVKAVRMAVNQEARSAMMRIGTRYITG